MFRTSQGETQRQRESVLGDYTRYVSNPDLRDSRTSLGGLAAKKDKNSTLLALAG